MKIFCFGNEFIKEDSLAKKIIDEIKLNKIEFVKCDSPDFLLDFNKEIIILDVIKNIKNVTLIKDVEKLKNLDYLSAHDLDLSFYLKLFKKLGKLKVNIIGIPQKGDKEKIKEDILKLDLISSSI